MQASFRQVKNLTLDQIKTINNTATGVLRGQDTLAVTDGAALNNEGSISAKNSLTLDQLQVISNRGAMLADKGAVSISNAAMLGQ